MMCNNLNDASNYYAVITSESCKCFEYFLSENTTQNDRLVQGERQKGEEYSMISDYFSRVFFCFFACRA